MPCCRSLSLVVCAGALACGPLVDRDRGPGAGLGVPVGPSTGGGLDGDEEEEDSGDDGLADDDGGGPTFDVGANEPIDPLDPQTGCNKVDFLFVIDNSASMEDEQAMLVDAFPGFMQTIEDSLGVGNDFHVTVTDTDPWGRCKTANPWDGHDPHSDLCNDYIKNTVFEECDRTLGAGVVHPAGKFASNTLCTPQGGKRYLEQGEPDLAGTFACMATVGTAGHPAERPMDALMAAISPAINGPGGCNEGFLRDDALLVVTFISDDPWYEDQGDPDSWYAALVAAKGGDPAAVVVLGLTPAWNGCREGTGPPKGGHWAQLVALFADHGLHGDVCGSAGDYVTFFQMAVSVIDEACDDFEPPG